MLRRLLTALGTLSGSLSRFPHYVADGAGWSVDMDGLHISEGIREAFGVRVPVLKDQVRLPYLRRQVIHFGTQGGFTGGGWGVVHPSNRVAVTFFHGDLRDPDFAPAIEVFRERQDRVDRVVVSCRIMERRMAEWGIAAEKVVRIPIGVDLGLFKPAPERKAGLRARLGVPPDHAVIGSFQKDGVGWGEGLEPKRVKGPDVFLEVVDRVRKRAPVFVLLTGPARGFVKKGLERLGVPCRHAMLGSEEEVAGLYPALDLYLVASREEGGPKAVMESMACGVPVVSTRVGMAADLIEDGVNGFLCEVDDAGKLAEGCLAALSDAPVRERFRAKGFETAKLCDFRTVVAPRHYKEVYKPLLETLR